MTLTNIKRTPHRRAIAMFFIIGLVGVAAWNALVSAWFVGAFASDGGVVWVNLTVNDLAHSQILQSPTGPMSSMNTLAGWPAPTVWLLSGLGFGLLASLLRLSFFGVIGSVMVWFSRSVADNSQTLLMGAAGEKRFVLNGNELANYLDICLLLVALLMVLSAQIAYANHARNRVLVGSGKEPTIGLLDVLHNMQSNVVERFTRAGGQVKTNAGNSQTGTGS